MIEKVVVAVMCSGCVVGAASSLGGGGSSSSGPSKPMVMPNLFNLTRPAAEAALRRAGYERDVSLDTSMCGSVVDGTIIERGRVCYQHPAPGASTGSKLPITLRVQDEDPWGGELSGGRRWLLMPDLAGTQVDKAREALRERGVTVEVQLAFVEEAGCAPNIVCRTYPEKLTRTDTTSDKVFYVGRPPDAPEPKPDAAKLDAPKPDTAKPDGTSKPAQPKQPNPGDLF